MAPRKGARKAKKPPPSAERDTVASIPVFSPSPPPKSPKRPAPANPQATPKRRSVANPPASPKRPARANPSTSPKRPGRANPSKSPNRPAPAKSKRRAATDPPSSPKRPSPAKAPANPNRRATTATPKPPELLVPSERRSIPKRPAATTKRPVNKRKLSVPKRKSLSSKRSSSKSVTEDSANEESESENDVTPPDTPTIKKRYRVPNVAEREIRFYQKSTNALIPRNPLCRLIREITQEITGAPDIRYKATALAAIHEATEHYIIGLIEDSYLITLHAKRATLYPNDLRLAYRIRGDGNIHT